MSVILVDARYLGQYLKSTRKTLRLKRADCAKMFGVTQRQVIQIESGKLLIPERMLERIICNGIMMIMCKKHK